MAYGQSVTEEQIDYIRRNIDLLSLRLMGKELGLSSKTVAKYAHQIRLEQMNANERTI